MKKQSNLKRILNYAEGKRGYIYVSGVLCAISALIGLAPYFFIWKIIKAVFMRSQPEGAISYGWDALLCAAVSAGLYILALALSYKAGISVATNIQKSMTLHLARIPINLVEFL